MGTLTSRLNAARRFVVHSFFSAPSPQPRFAGRMAVFYPSAGSLTARLSIVFAILFVGLRNASAQVDSLQRPRQDSVVAWDSSGKPVAMFDSTTFDAMPAKKKHSPKTATLRSLVLPGWGQAYNREYWKIPIVWGALAIPITAYIRNNIWYKEAAKTYNIVYNATQIGSQDASVVSALLAGYKDYQEYWDKLYALNSATAGTSFLSVVQSNRNYYRRNRDYSVLWTLLLWGVNVADATVFGHLHNFDVSPNLSVQVNPTYLQEIRAPGINIVFNLK
ncbi:MAG: DUF5683 domain-containing protein [Chitinophagaceae bacterium]